MKTYCFDIDGVICENIIDRNYSKAKPKKDVIQKINSIYSKGCYIKIFTSRGIVSGLNWTEITKQQLKDWGVKYDELIMNKPHADFYIDDKAINIKDWMNA